MTAPLLKSLLILQPILNAKGLSMEILWLCAGFYTFMFGMGGADLNSISPVRSYFSVL